MNKTDFLNQPNVTHFIEWASNTSLSLLCGLDIRHSAKVPGGIQANCIGLNDVLAHYTWNASWSDGEHKHASCDWQSTKQSLQALAVFLQEAVASGDQRRALHACLSILKWGGDRNSKVGATPQLEALAREDQLVEYLLSSRKTFELTNCDLSQLQAIQFAGSMWTKIYALNSFDGLPIYDSRVGAAIAALVEVYRVQTGRNWQSVPEELNFKIERYRNRTVKRLNSEGLSPGHMRRASPNFASDWSSATTRLAWLIQAVLERQPALFIGEETQVDKMHAFEATLFVMGYDTMSLAPNLT